MILTGGNTRGFSLIETLVATAIAALAFAVITTSFKQSKNAILRIEEDQKLILEARNISNRIYSGALKDITEDYSDWEIQRVSENDIDLYESFKITNKKHKNFQFTVERYGYKQL